MGRCIAGRRGTFTLSLILAGTLLCPGWTKHGIAIADKKPGVSAPQQERGQKLPAISRNITRHWPESHYTRSSWDSGFIRNGKSGSGMILTWNKSF